MQRLVKISFYVLLFVMVGLGSVANAQAPGPVPTTQWIFFYSANSKLNGQPVPIGAVVKAYNSQEVLCGQVTVSTPGSYGLMSCYLYDNDPTTPPNAGVRPGETVRFTINDQAVVPSFQVPATVSHGDRYQVDLASPSAPGPAEIPEPITLITLGSGLAALAGYMRLRRKSQTS